MNKNIKFVFVCMIKVSEMSLYGICGNQNLIVYFNKPEKINKDFFS